MKTLIRLSMLFGIFLLLLTAVFSLARREEPTVAWMFIYDNGDLVRMHPDGRSKMTLYTNIRSILDTSPDGSWIIFEAREPDGELGLYRLAWNGKHPYRLTHWDVDWRLEAWTPDGRQMVLAKTNYPNQGVLEVLTIETGVRQHLTDSGRFVTVSSDSQWIYYQVLRTPRGDGDVWSLMRVDPSRVEEQFVVTMNEFATWSPDGEWLYLRRGDYQLHRLRP